MQILKKYIPLIILAIFLIGGYFIMNGMNRAISMTKEKHEIKKS